MCRDTATDLTTLFEPPLTITTDQDLPFDYVNATILNDRGVYKRGNVLQFILPKEGVLTPQSVRLFFNLIFDGRDTDTRRLFNSYDISNIFSRVTLTYGRTVILEDIQEYGQLSQLFSIHTKSGLQPLTREGLFSGETITGQLPGMLDLPALRAFPNNPSVVSVFGPGQAPRRYMIKLNLGMFQQNKPLPLIYMNEELRLNFYLQDQVQKFAFTQSGSTGEFGPVVTEFQLGQPVLRYKIHYPSLHLKTQIFNHMSSNQFTLQWTSFQHQKFQLSSSQTDQTLIVRAFRKRIKYALAVIRSEVDIDDPQADATSTYVSLDPRVPNTASSGNTVDQARKTSLKEYQWIYNNRNIPSQPVKVLGVHPVYTYVLNQPTDSLYNVELNHGSAAAEAYYYFQQTLGIKHTGPVTRDTPWVIQDSWHGGALAPITTQFNLSQATPTSRKAPCSFVIAGKFFDTVTLPDGTKQETTIDCASLNSNLQLKLVFNNRSGPSSGYSAPYPPMYVDVWVAYNVICQINELGEVVIEQ